MTNNFNEYLWVEKYRPRKVSDCILSDSLRETFQKMVDGEEIQNLLLSGGAGCGKTTIAKAICEELGCDYMVINCSEDGNIDTLRTKIRNFASSVSMSGGKKVVILDEFDYSNAKSLVRTVGSFLHATTRTESSNLFIHDALVWSSLSLQRRNPPSPSLLWRESNSY